MSAASRNLVSRVFPCKLGGESPGNEVTGSRSLQREGLLPYILGILKMQYLLLYDHEKGVPFRWGEDEGYRSNIGAEPVDRNFEFILLGHISNDLRSQNCHSSF